MIIWYTLKVLHTLYPVEDGRGTSSALLLVLGAAAQNSTNDGTTVMDPDGMVVGLLLKREWEVVSRMMPRML